MTIFDSNTFFGSYPKKKVDWSLGKLEEILRENGISQALSYSLRGVFYNFAEGNDETLQLSKQRDWLIPVATVDPRRHLGCLQQVQRMREAGVKAFRFFPEEQNWPLDFLPLQNLLKEIDRNGGLALLPAGENGLPTQILRLAENLSLPIILVGVTYWNLGEAIACLQAREDLYLETHRMVMPKVIDLLASEVGVERIIYGSRAPELYVRPSINMVEYSSLSQQDKNKILSGNLLRLLERE